MRIPILIVEKDAGQARRLRQMLGSRYGILMARNASEAIDRFRTKPISAVLLDLDPPQNAGLESFMEVRAQWPSIPIVVMAGKASQASALEAPQNGAWHCMVKNEITRRSLIEILDSAAPPARPAAIHKRLNRIAETMQDVYWVTTPDLSKTCYVSPSYEKLYGRSCRHAYTHPQSFLEMIHPDDRARFLMMADPRNQNDQRYRIVKPDGSIRWLHDHSVPIKDQSGQVIRISRLVQDITERRQMEDALTASEEEYHSLVATLAEGVIVLSAEGRILKYNASAERLLGLTPERLRELSLNNPLWHAIREDGSAFSPETLHALFASPVREIAASRTLGMSRPDGSLVWLLGTTRSLSRPGENAPYGFVVSFSDITERKQAEMALQESQERLERLNRDLESEVSQRTDELRKREEELYQARKLEAVGRLAGGVAHDFNNLMTGIMGIAEELKESFSSPDPRCQDVHDIIEAAHRAFAVTRQLLAFGRRQISIPKVLDVNSVIRDFAKITSRLIGEDIRLNLDLSEVRPVKIDPTHLEQILMNLSVNARDAMPQGGSITIRTRQVDSQRSILLEFSDCGCGMDPETVEHIFEPFFTTKAKDHGTGLGLSTVYGIVKQNGAEIAVKSLPGAGTTFMIYFAEEPSPVLPEEAPIVRPESAGAGGETVLVVEDDDIVRRVVVNRLRHAGYAVLEARDGKQALEFNGGISTIDLVVTDVVMPGMNGQELIDRLRIRRPHVAVLYMSGYPEDIISKRGLLGPGIHFIEKSLIAGHLHAKVREALDHSHAIQVSPAADSPSA